VQCKDRKWAGCRVANKRTIDVLVIWGLSWISDYGMLHMHSGEVQTSREWDCVMGCVGDRCPRDFAAVSFTQHLARDARRKADDMQAIDECSSRSRRCGSGARLAYRGASVAAHKELLGKYDDPRFSYKLQMAWSLRLAPPALPSTSHWHRVSVPSLQLRLFWLANQVDIACSTY